MVHGCVAPIIFSLCVVTAVISSRIWWGRDGSGRIVAASDRYAAGAGDRRTGPWSAMRSLSWVRSFAMSNQIRHPAALP